MYTMFLGKKTINLKISIEHVIPTPGIMAQCAFIYNLYPGLISVSDPIRIR